ncbi:MAG: InlB B-repeat-containing protein, partial [Lachnospiraceae bacterium]|nr:InlB B-repeat-containing protein [Lachnospiraceae bacterium]
ETPYDGDKCLHWYLASAGKGEVIYKGTGSNGITLEPGAYTFEVMAQGNDGDKVTLSVLDHGKNSTFINGTATSMIGWANWVTPSVNFTITETTTVDLGITIGIQAGGWGTVDCMYLYQTEAYASHQVTFVDGTKSFAKKVADGRSATAPVWSKAGYSLGWDKSLENITSDITVTAVWTPIEYQITYSLNGGVNSADNPTEYTVESGTVELKNPSKNGYIFKGWYKEASFENPVSSVQALEDGDITVYAKWEALQMSIGDVESENGTLDADSLVEELKSKGAFTSAEIIQIGLGGSVSVYMKVNDVSDTVSETDKNEVLGKLASENYDVIGCYLDLQLIKQIGSDPAKNITKLDQPISITIVIPEDLINTNPNSTRTYAIVRVHVDAVSGEISTEFIPGSFDPSTNEFTFETDRFSTYAIVYKDTVTTTGITTPSSPSGEASANASTPVTGATPDAAAASEAVSTTLASPDTSDNQSVAPFILMMAAAFAMMGAAAFARRRKTR